MLCTNIVLNVKQKQKKNNVSSQHVLTLYFSRNSMNNHLSYCGLTNARMRASEKYLPVFFGQKIPRIAIVIRTNEV